MTFRVNKTAFAAAVALTAAAGLTLPAAATPYHHGYHGVHRSSAYREGYRRGFRDGHYAAAGADVTTGRSAYVGPGPVVGAVDNGVFGNGGVLGLGVLGGNGILGTGVRDGRGALGLGVLGL